MTDGWAGLKVVAVLEAANRSLANGGQREALPEFEDITQVESIKVHWGYGDVPTITIVHMAEEPRDPLPLE